MTAVDPVAAARYFVQTIGCTAFPVWGSRDGRCLCGDPHDGTRKHGLDNVGKHPATEHGFKDGTDDLDKIQRFLHNPGTPNYGLNAPAGVMIIDVDGPDGLAAWDDLQHRYGPLPITLTTTTANGRHYFYRWPVAAGPMPTGKLFGFVVRRHDDGYVIGPGSVHPKGVVYDTLRQPSGMPYDIADLPASWANVALKPDVITITASSDPSAVPVGGRHDWLRNTARLFAGVIRDPDALKAAVLVENAKLPVPKSEAEVDRAIGAVLKRFGPDPVEVDEDTGETRRVYSDEVGMLPPAASGTFPPPADSAAFRGVLGECAMTLAEDTDASLVGLLGSLLAFAGALIPGQAYQHRMQTTSPFVALVGESSIGRKGTAMWRAHGAMSDALEAVYVNRVVLDGVNSGEGLIATMAYRQSTYPQEPTVGLVFEEEYASLLASRARDGSTLDPKMRAAWDGGPLSNRRSSGTVTVSPPYWLPALIAITPVELRQRIGADAMQSGSANRWLYLPVERRDVVTLSTPPRFEEEHRKALQAARRASLDAVRPVTGTDPRVTVALSEYQEHVASVSSGSARDLTKRLPMTAFRIALVHAMVERGSTVTMEHLERAMALTEYARSGIDWVFGGTVGNRDADLLLRSLRKVGSLAQNTITRQIIRDPIRRQDAMDELVRLGYAVVNTVRTTGGRPREELAINPLGAGYVRFVLHPDIAHPLNSQNRGDSGRNTVNNTDETGTKAGRKVDETVTKDAETGEVQDKADATWLRACRDYTAHQDHHRRTPQGWICTACDQQEDTPA